MSSEILTPVMTSNLVQSSAALQQPHDAGMDGGGERSLATFGDPTPVGQYPWGHSS